MEGDAGGDFQDWEVLHGNSDETNSVTSSDSVENITGNLVEEGIDGDSQGMIQTDYFSLDSTHTKYVKEEGAGESDVPSWIDPASDSGYPRKDSSEFWPDSGSDRSDDHKFSEFEYKHELGFAENAKSQAGFEGIGEIGAEGEELRKFWSGSGGMGPISMELGGVERHTDVVIGGNANSSEGSKVSGEENGGDGEGGKESVAIGAVKPSGEEERRSVVWWKVPFEFLKFCAFRVNPVWTFSVAAAVMGFVILGRRLYKMKRKSQSLQLKVTMDDKKVSQFMSRVARLNEAFSVVKRVPVIRPSLPASGVTPWPVMSLR